MAVQILGTGVQAFFSFGRFTPYLERERRRFSTPEQSRGPRTMW
jgi:hypothetical protein